MILVIGFAFWLASLYMRLTFYQLPPTHTIGIA